jgi:membrane dipeptidase
LKKKILIIFAALLCFGLALFFFVVPGQVDGRYNSVFKPPPYGASVKASALHRDLFIADLHADSLLWNRDLLLRNERGHVDLPRLREGNVALQVFTIVTKVPWGLNIESNSDRSDMITPLAVAERWPTATWGSLKERTLYQAGRLSDVAARSEGRLLIIRTVADLSAYLERRKHEPGLIAALLGVEGAHALEGDLSNLDLFFERGIRLMSPTHFFDNDLGGSAHGLRKGGLTEKGRELIRRMEAKHMILDLAHASPQVIDDALAIATRPVVVSHTGVKGTCDNTRNLSDAQLKSIARAGGLIGIGYWETAVCGRDAKAIARAIRYAANQAGVEHIALGSDFDGFVSTPFDSTGLVQITDALLAENFTEPEIRMIMGENALRVLMQDLP